MLLRRRGARIWLRDRRPGLTNSFAPIYAAVVHPHDRGTRIVGIFRLHRLVVIFMVVWLAIVTASTGTILMVGLRDLLGGGPRAVNGDPWTLFSSGPGLLGMAGIIWVVGRWLGKKDEREISSFVKQLLDAREMAPGSDAFYRNNFS